MRAADWGWAVVAAAVAVYEVAALGREWELLSEACDRYRARHPVAVGAAVCYLAGHLLRVWPRRVDPLHVIAGRARR